MKKLMNFSYQLIMRILFVSFMMVAFAISHVFALSVDKPDIQAEHISDRAVSQVALTSEFPDLSVPLDFIQASHNSGHSASSCSMDHRVYSLVSPLNQSALESITWYYSGGDKPQKNPKHLLRPPIT